MRKALLTGLTGLLTAAGAAAQSPPALSPAAAASAPASLPPATVPNVTTVPDLGTPAEDWYMHGPRFRATVQYSLWWITPMNTPDLIQGVDSAIAVQSITDGTPLPAGAAVRLFPETRQLDFGAFNGGRANFGVNFDRFGVEVDFLYLPQVTKSSDLYNSGVPISLAQSYLRAGDNTPISLFASLDGSYSGGIRAEASSRLYGAEINARFPFFNLFTDATDTVAGFRYLDLQEQLNINSRSDFSNGNSLTIQDSIHTTNRFYGAQLGLNGRVNGVRRGLGFDTTGKLALGGVHQEASLSGSNTYLIPGQPADTENGGLYARGAAIGNYSRDKIAMVYEQTFNLTYNFDERCQVFFGYSIIWISSVMRPGEAIDPYINDSNVRFVAGAPAGSTLNRPAFSWNANDLWTQGMNFGLRLQY